MKNLYNKKIKYISNIFWLGINNEIKDLNIMFNSYTISDLL